MEITGIIHKIFETQQISATFQKRAFVLRQDNVGNDGKDYPEFISLEFIQDKVDVINSYQEGQEVEVLFNIKGRHWKDDKYFNTLQAWKMHSAKGEPDMPPAPIRNDVPQPSSKMAELPKTENPPTTTNKGTWQEAQDDIPF